MAAHLFDYEVVHPADLDEALDALSSVPELVPLAGGTDLMAYLEGGVLQPCTLLNLQTIGELHGAPAFNGELTLPALATFRDARVTPVVREKYPMLAAAAAEVGTLAIQSRGTWTGNIANASPAADGVPALMAYDAEIELTGRLGRRTVSLDRFYTGYKQMDRRPNELITAIRVPPPGPGWRQYFRKVGARRYQAISKTLLAGRMLMGSEGEIRDIRLIFGSVAPFTLRAFRTEQVVRGKELTPDLIRGALAALQDEISPIGDIRSSAAYRRHVSANLLRDFLSRCSTNREPRQ
jgi:CO/xanthine dehydrogenase FAD-binding subunit